MYKCICKALSESFKWIGMNCGVFSRSSDKFLSGFDTWFSVCLAMTNSCLWETGFNSNHICSLRIAVSFWLVPLKEAINLNCYSLHFLMTRGCYYYPSAYQHISLSGDVLFHALASYHKNTAIVSNHICENNWKRNLGQYLFRRHVS